MARRDSICDSREVKLIGCCGAYCKTCRSFVLGSCRGCKVGYDEGERQISRARCRVKSCCLGAKRLDTCAECPGHDSCDLLTSFHGKKKSAEYARYKESLEFIRTNGYPEFLRRAKGWTRSHGDLSEGDEKG